MHNKNSKRIAALFIRPYICRLKLDFRRWHNLKWYLGMHTIMLPIGHYDNHRGGSGKIGMGVQNLLIFYKSGSNTKTYARDYFGYCWKA